MRKIRNYDALARENRERDRYEMLQSLAGVRSRLPLLATLPPASPTANDPIESIPVIASRQAKRTRLP